MTLRYPFDGSYEITSPFGVPHRITGTHQGVDFGLPLGTPLLAVTHATVSFINLNDPDLGNAIELDIGGGYFVRYAHLSQVLVTVGQPVQAGQIIGKSGNTGASDGPHLHNEIYRKKGGQPFYYEDITKYLEGESMPTPDEVSSAFKTYGLTAKPDQVTFYSARPWRILLDDLLKAVASREKGTVKQLNDQIEQLKKQGIGVNDPNLVKLREGLAWLMSSK